VQKSNLAKREFFRLAATGLFTKKDRETILQAVQDVVVTSSDSKGAELSEGER
jgi:hypothetical protein